jgi:alkaline phosphatase
MKVTKYLFLFFCISVFSQCQSTKAQQGLPRAKKVILLIGDGMGLTQIQAAMTANGNQLNLDRFPIVGLAKTSAADSYITDSAAGATAFSAGVKTRNGAVGVDTRGNSVKTILEYAEEEGYASGLVATSTITHATPAAFIAHNLSRNNYEAIAEDFLRTDIDVFIGGGLSHFVKRKDSVDLTTALKDNGYQVITNLAEIGESGTRKLAGLLNDGAMPTIEQGRGGMLIESCRAALRILDKNENGFFLMVEGSQIDWGGHANKISYVVTELLDFDKVIGAVLDYAIADGNTLVVVTADHETGGLTIHGADILGDSTATSYSTRGHTPVMVPVFAFGPGAARFSGIYENTEIFDKMMAAFGFIAN